MGLSPSEATYVDPGPSMAPGSNPPNLNPRRVTGTCDTGTLLQANIYIECLQTYYSQKPGIAIAGGVFIAVFLLMVMVMIYTLIKRRKALLRDRRRIVVSGKEPKRYHDELISFSHASDFSSESEA